MNLGEFLAKQWDSTHWHHHDDGKVTITAFKSGTVEPVKVTFEGIADASQALPETPDSGTAGAVLPQPVSDASPETVRDVPGDVSEPDNAAPQKRGNRGVAK